MATQKRKRKSADNATRVITAGTTVRIEQPKSDRKRKPRASEVAVVVAQEVNPVTGFVGFLREHAIVGLAIGFVVATQVQALVKQLITSFIDPLFGLLGGQTLSQRTFVLHFHGRSAEFGWGVFAYTFMDFLFVLAAIYVILKFFNLDKLDKPKENKK